MGAVDDAAIVVESLAEPSRFAVLFDRHAPVIFRYLSRRMGRHQAADLLEETFLAAFNSRSRFDTSRSDARPWLYGIATNIVAAHWREEIRQLRIRAALSTRTELVSHIERIETDLVAQSLRAVLVDSLLQLDASHRNVLMLFAWEELSYDEIASVLDIPVGTVRSRLHRARTTLRRVLAESPDHFTIEEVLNDG